MGNKSDRGVLMDLNNLARDKIIMESESNSGNIKLEISGLSSDQVQERIKQGKVNYIPKAPSRTFWQICRANLFTSFNAINFILAVIIVLAGSPKNAVFVGVIVVNTLIGICQELKAKKTLEKLSVISMAHAKVIRVKYSIIRT